MALVHAPRNAGLHSQKHQQLSKFPRPVFLQGCDPKPACKADIKCNPNRVLSDLDRASVLIQVLGRPVDSRQGREELRGRRSPLAAGGHSGAADPGGFGAEPAAPGAADVCLCRCGTGRPHPRSVCAKAAWPVPHKGVLWFFHFSIAAPHNGHSPASRHPPKTAWLSSSPQ